MGLGVHEYEVILKVKFSCGHYQVNIKTITFFCLRSRKGLGVVQAFLSNNKHHFLCNPKAQPYTTYNGENSLYPSPQQRIICPLFHTVYLMLRSHTIQYSLLNHHPFPSFALSTEVSFLWSVHQACKLSTDLHWDSLVCDFGLHLLGWSLRTWEVFVVCGAIGDQSWVRVGPAAFSTHCKAVSHCSLLWHSTHRDSPPWTSPIWVPPMASSSPWTAAPLGPSHRVHHSGAGCFRSFQHQTCSSVGSSFHWATGSARSQFQHRQDSMASLGHPPALVLGFSRACGCIGICCRLTHPQSQSFWSRSSSLGTCQPRHMVVAVIKCSRHGSEVIRAMWQWWEQNVATNKQWGLTDLGKQAHGKHRSFQAIAAQKDQLSIRSRTSQSNLSLSQTLLAPCWAPKRAVLVSSCQL